jgi:hypothetical protein
MFNPAALARASGGGGGVVGLVRRLVMLGFAAIQLILVARILLDLGILPAEGGIADFIVPLSDVLAAPVQGLGSGLGGLLGGGIPGLGPAGGGVDPTMLAALAGWTVVEGLVLMVVRKFAAA